MEIEMEMLVERLARRLYNLDLCKAGHVVDAGPPTHGLKSFNVHEKVFRVKVELLWLCHGDGREAVKRMLVRPLGCGLFLRDWASSLVDLLW